MTEQSRTQPARPPRPITQRFPGPGRRVEQAYRELDIALYGSDEEKKALGSPRMLPRPWDPPTCVDPDLRAELWEWLEAVVTWLNHEYVWDVSGIIPHCWPKHPHLAHEVAVLADLRRRAGQALSSDALEEWHRYALPAFSERMRSRMRAHCEDKDHQPWPAQGRHARHAGPDARQERAAVFQADVDSLDLMDTPGNQAPPLPRLHLVDGLRIDRSTGEVRD